MSAEDFREDVTRAMEKAVAGETDLDDIEGVLEAKLERVEELRILRGER